MSESEAEAIRAAEMLETNRNSPAVSALRALMRVRAESFSEQAAAAVVGGQGADQVAFALGCSQFARDLGDELEALMAG